MSLAARRALIRSVTAQVARTSTGEEVARANREEIEAAFVRQMRGAQVDIVDGIIGSRFASILGARQFGKSTAVAFAVSKLARGGTWKGTRVEPQNVHVISRTRELASDFIRRTRVLLETYDLDLPPERKEDSVFDARLGSTARIVLANGKHIHSHAGRPRSIQGWSGTVIVDEIGAAEFDPETMLAQAIAAASNSPDFRYVMIGNSNKRGSWWHRWWTSEDAEISKRRAHFRLIRRTIEDVYPGGLPPHIAEVKTVLRDVDWRRWFLCEFLESLEVAFSSEQITACTMTSPRAPDGRVIVSIDPGLVRNPTGYVVGRVSLDSLDVVECGQWAGPMSDATEAERSAWVSEVVRRVVELVTRYGPAVVLCDHANVANQVGTALVARLGSLVRLVATTADAKQRWFGTLHGMISDGRLHLPAGPGSRALREDLEHLEVEAARERLGGIRGLEHLGVLTLPSRPLDSGHVSHCDVAAALLMMCGEVGTVAKAPDLPPPTRFPNRFGIVN